LTHFFDKLLTQEHEFFNNNRSIHRPPDTFFRERQDKTKTKTMNSLRCRPQVLHIAVAIGLFLLSSLRTEAWVSPAPSLGSKNAAAFGGSHHQKPSALFYSSDNEFGSNITDSSPTASSTSVVERLRINGVSVSPKGFHVLLESTTGKRSGRSDAGERDSNEKNLQKSSKETEKAPTNNGKNSVLPLKMTNDPADAFAATSPESLTLCQLLSGVDMAGAILPPELLGTIVACHVEDKLDALYEDDEDKIEPNDTKKKDEATFTPVVSPIEGKIWEYLQNQQALLREQNLFGSSQQSADSSSSSFRVQMPQVTLDQLTLRPSSEEGSSSSTWQCKLECALPEWKERIVVDVRSDLVASLAYNYDPEASPLFTCIALALRYKAPIVLEDSQTPQTNQLGDSYWSSKDELDRDFPQRTTLENLQQQSTRVTQNIEKGFEINKLTGALQIAMRLGDKAAAEKIRAKLDEYDSMEDLPTLQSKDETKSDQRYRLDDLDNNILQ
jgi:hypothetical protein